jgi:hypothetical protein
MAIRSIFTALLVASAAQAQFGAQSSSIASVASSAAGGFAPATSSNTATSTSSSAAPASPALSSTQTQASSAVAAAASSSAVGTSPARTSSGIPAAPTESTGCTLHIDHWHCEGPADGSSTPTTTAQPSTPSPTESPYCMARECFEPCFNLTTGWTKSAINLHEP